MKPYVRVKVEPGGKVVLEGNAEGLDELQAVIEKAVSSQAGVGETRDKRWRVVRVDGRGKRLARVG